MKSHLGKGDVLFGKIRPYFHKVVRAPFAGVASSDAIVIRSAQGATEGLVLAVASSDEFVAHATQTSNGTKMPRASWTVLAEWLVPIPPSGLLERFNALILEGANLAAKLNGASASLMASRDLLLPRLVSGQLSVVEAERLLEAAE